MSLIAMQDVYFGYGGPALLEGVNFLIDEGERVSLVGRNGCGKSTLLKLVHGPLEVYSGEITRQPNLRIAMLSQSVPQNTNGKVFDIVAQGLGRAGELLIEYHNITHNQKPGSNQLLSRLGSELDKADSWKKLNIVETVLSMTDIDPEIQFSELSAGLKRRVMTSKALPEQRNQDRNKCRSQVRRYCR